MGILIERKGVADLLKAVNKIALDKKVNNMRLVIAGTGKEEEKLKQMSKDLDIDQYITFAGWTSGEKKCELLRNCQLLVLPSYNEGLPIAILEALSYGMPVVATDVGDISSAVKDNKNGYLIQPGDYSQLAIALEKIASSRELYIKMSDASRDIAEKAFNEKVYFKQLKVCYENCSRLCYNFGLGGRDAFF